MEMFYKLISVVKDITLIIAAMFTMYGFNKWRVEHKGKAYIDTAKILLASVYSVRNNFALVRSGCIYASELPEGYAAKRPSSVDSEYKSNAMWHAYKNRLCTGQNRIKLNKNNPLEVS